MALISVSVEEIQALHDYFSARKDSLPETLMISPAERVNDVTWLIDQCFGILSDNGISERMRGMRLDLLKRMKAALEQGAGEP